MEQFYTIVGIAFTLLGILAIISSAGFLKKCSNCGSRLTFTKTSSSGQDASYGNLEHIYIKCHCFRCKVTETEHKTQANRY